jgi:NitT/TauT family transport system ATP-binding protein
MRQLLVRVRHNGPGPRERPSELDQSGITERLPVDEAAPLVLPDAPAPLPTPAKAHSDAPHSLSRAPRDVPAVAPLIHFDAVSVEFPGGTRALNAVSLAVRRGELVALVGPSGCGKSTLLRLVAGFMQPSGGALAVQARALGYVFQEPTLLAWRSVYENVELPAVLTGMPEAERRARAASAIGRVGLGGFEGHRPAELSGGMRMRVSLARALMTDPDVFLFDEPFGALDEITRERLHDELVSLFAADPFAALFVTHSVPEAVFLSTRVVVLSARPGQIAAEFAVPFGWPRRAELRYTPEFAALAGHVSAALRSVA